jgi:uroporphyrinogen decarboxylase
MKIEFSPAVYEHAAYLIGARPWEVSRDPELIYRGHLKAYELYSLPFMVLGIDIYNLEAEAYGCPVHDPGGNGIPAITEHIFADLDDALQVKPFDPVKDGRIPMLLACGRRMLKEVPPGVVRIPVSGPFSIATNLLSADELLTSVITRPADTVAFLRRLVEGQVRFCRAIVEAGLGIALFESAATPPLLSPQQFREIELPAMKELMQRLHEELGVVAPLILGGNTAPIVDDMVSSGTKYVICPAETDQQAFMAAIARYPDVAVRVNLKTTVVVNGPVPAILREVDKILAMAASAPNKVLLGTGAVPYETPPEHVLAIKEYVS